MVSVWCADDRRKALTDAKNDRPVPAKTCKTPVDMQHAAGLRMGLEGTPMILLEAMQDGVPVVAFGVGGIPDVIEHGRSGLLANALAVDELAAQVEALMLDPAQANELIGQARRTQRERYHLPTLAQRWAQVYLGAAKETCA